MSTIDTYEPEYIRPSTHIIDLNGEPASDKFDPKAYSEEVRKAHTPPGQTLAKKFPHLEYAAIPVDARAEDWSLELSGEIERPQKVELLNLMKRPSHDYGAAFHCITGWSLFDMCWTGVLGWDILEMVKPHELLPNPGQG